MNLDIRVPIGLLFVTLGLLLTAFGAISDRAIYARSLGVNVNLWWGLVLLAFGAIMGGFGLRASAGKSKPADGGGDDLAPRGRH